MSFLTSLASLNLPKIPNSSSTELLLGSLTLLLTNFTCFLGLPVVWGGAETALSFLETVLETVLETLSLLLELLVVLPVVPLPPLFSCSWP